MGMFERDMVRRLIRIESKMVRGFEELGLDISGESDWLFVDDDEKIVRISTLGRSLSVILAEMKRAGATHYGEIYQLIYQDKSIGSLHFIPSKFSESDDALI